MTSQFQDSFRDEFSQSPINLEQFCGEIPSVNQDDRWPSQLVLQDIENHVESKAVSFNGPQEVSPSPQKPQARTRQIQVQPKSGKHTPKSGNTYAMNYKRSLLKFDPAQVIQIVNVERVAKKQVDHQKVDHQKVDHQKVEPKEHIPPPRKKLELAELYDKEVQMKEFRLEQILGSGAYATVRKGVHKKSQEAYAIKIYDKAKLADQQRMANLKREIHLMKKLQHPNIIKLHYALDDRKSVNLVMECVKSIPLSSYVKQKSNKQVPTKDALSITFQISQAMKYLHQKNIAHRDIKMDNVLLTHQNIVKLIDFGFSIQVAKSSKLNIFCGTPSYMSPQIVTKVTPSYRQPPLQTPHAPFSSDVWSLGILLSTLITGQHPFRGSNDRDLYRKIQAAQWKAPEGVKVNEQVERVIKGCLEKNLESRWTIEQVLGDEIFNEFRN